MVMNITKAKMKNFKSQAGWTIWGLIFVLGTVGFFSYVGIRLVPMFSENQSIANAMERSVQDENLSRITRNKIINTMENQLYLDGAHDIVDYKKAMTVTRTSGQLKIVLDYQRTVPLFANISILATFTPTLECRLSSGECEKK